MFCNSSNSPKDGVADIVTAAAEELVLAVPLPPVPLGTAAAADTTNAAELAVAVPVVADGVDTIAGGKLPMWLCEPSVSNIAFFSESLSTNVSLMISPSRLIIIFSVMIIVCSGLCDGVELNAVVEVVDVGNDSDIAGN